MYSYKKKKSTRSKRALKKVLKTRGGFIPSPTSAQWKAMAGSLATDAFKRYSPAAKKWILQASKDALDKMNVPDRAKIAPGWTIGKISDAAETLLNSNKDEAIFSEKDSEAKRSTGDLGNLGKRYTTKFVVGQPPTNTLKRLSKNNGVVKAMNLDTLYSDLYIPETNRRVSLSTEAGFNQKTYSLWVDMHWTYTQLAAELGLDAYSLPDFTQQANYLSALSLDTSMRILNVGSYFPSDVTIEVYSQKNLALESNALMISAFPTQAEFTALSPNLGLLPNYLWQKGRSNNASKITCNVDPVATMMQAPLVEKRYEHIRTFKKRLKPGDIWDWSCSQKMGPGIKWELFERIRASKDSANVGYTFVISQKGVPCEAVLQDSANNSVVGSSPSWLSVEFQKSCTYIPKETLMADTQIATAGGGVRRRPVHVRTYQQSVDASLTRRTKINYAAELIQPKGQAMGGIYIPVLTDKIVNYAYEASAE